VTVGFLTPGVVCMYMDAANMLKAQLGVLARAAVTGGVGYMAWALVSGGSFDPAVYGKIVAALFAAANAVFWFVKWYRPDVLYAAKTAEEEL